MDQVDFVIDIVLLFMVIHIDQNVLLNQKRKRLLV